MLIYFKVSARLLIKDSEEFVKEKIPLNMLVPNIILASMLLISGVFIAPLLSSLLVPIANDITNTQSIISSSWLSLNIGFTTVPFWTILLGWLIVVAIPLLSLIHYKNIDRTKVYNCAERVDINLASYYFKMPLKLFSLGGIAFYTILVISGVIL